VNPSSLNLLSKTCESGSTSVRPGIAVGTPEQKGHGHVMLRAAFENVFQGEINSSESSPQAVQGLFVRSNKTIILTSSFTPATPCTPWTRVAVSEKLKPATLFLEADRGSAAKV
jgi:hypothetical protein